jgi:hypothetical protein
MSSAIDVPPHVGCDIAVLVDNFALETLVSKPYCELVIKKPRDLAGTRTARLTSAVARSTLPPESMGCAAGEGKP